MAKESDADLYVITADDVWETVTFNGTFSAAPSVVCISTGQALVGKKVCVKDVTTTNFQIQGEVALDAHYIALEKGFDDADPQTAAGTHLIFQSKALEAVSFGDTFDTEPEVNVTAAGATAQKKTGSQNITTTGFLCYSEVAEKVNWIAREKEYS